MILVVEAIRRSYTTKEVQVADGDFDESLIDKTDTRPALNISTEMEEKAFWISIQIL